MKNNNYNGSSPKKDALLLVGHLVLATDHILEASLANEEDSQRLLENAYAIDNARVEIQKNTARDLHETEWCLYKHLAAARVLAQELFKAGGEEYVEAYNEGLILEINGILTSLWGDDYEACATCKDDRNGGEA